MFNKPRALVTAAQAAESESDASALFGQGSL